MADVLATPGARLTMILVATALFLGLAVLGWASVAFFVGDNRPGLATALNAALRQRTFRLTCIRICLSDLLAMRGQITLRSPRVRRQ